MRNYLNSCILALSVLFAGCTSLHERAEKHFQAQEYSAAIELYEELISKNSKDGLAKDRVKMARQRRIEDRLIQVRQNRLSNNFDASLDELDKILSEEKEHNISPTGHAFATQMEEVNLLFSWVVEQTNENIKNGRPLRASEFFKTKESIFVKTDKVQKVSNLKKTIVKAGQSHCKSLEKKSSGAFSQAFSKSYCNFWGVNSGASRSIASVPSAILTFNTVNINGQIKNLPTELNSLLSEKILTGLKTTPFFGESNKALVVGLSGVFLSSIKERDIVLTHSYHVKIPYTEINTVPKMERVPYTDYQTQYDYRTGLSYSVPYTAYKLETRYVQEAVTKFREEPRSMVYPAVESTTNYALVGNLRFQIDGFPLEIPINHQFSKTESYHSNSNREVGLSPQNKEAPAAIDWLKDNFASIDSTVKEKISDRWEKKYCEIAAKETKQVEVESIFKCMKGSSGRHEFVDNWFKNNFGYDQENTMKLVGFGA